MPWPEAAEESVSFSLGLSFSRSSSRSLDSASLRLPSTTRKVTLRWSGTRSSSQASGGTVTAVSRFRMCSRVGSSGSAEPNVPAAWRSLTCFSAARAKSGAGTKLRRTAFGSARM